MAVIEIKLPERVQATLNRTDEEMAHDIRLYAALMLYQLGKLSSGTAAQLAGMPRVQFLELCGEYGITVLQRTPEELAAQLTTDG